MWAEEAHIFALANSASSRFSQTLAHQSLGVIVSNPILLIPPPKERTNKKHQIPKSMELEIWVQLLICVHNIRFLPIEFLQYIIFFVGSYNVFHGEGETGLWRYLSRFMGNSSMKISFSFPPLLPPHYRRQKCVVRPQKRFIYTTHNQQEGAKKNVKTLIE